MRTTMPAPEAVDVVSPIPGLADDPIVVAGKTMGRPLRNLNGLRAIVCERARLADIRIHGVWLRFA